MVVSRSGILWITCNHGLHDDWKLPQRKIKYAISSTLLLSLVTCGLIINTIWVHGLKAYKQKRNNRLVPQRKEPSHICVYAVCAHQHVCGIHVKAESDISGPAGLLGISGFPNYPLPVKLGQNERASTYFSMKSCSRLNRQASENKP